MSGDKNQISTVRPAVPRIDKAGAASYLIGERLSLHG
jgi:hypothetical protein